MRGKEVKKISMVDGLSDEVYAEQILTLSKIQEKSVLSEIQAISLGNIALASIPGELFVEYGLEIKKKSPFPHTFIIGYANDVNWGVIGACGIADRRTIPEGIIPAKNAELVALMDVDEERLRKVAKKYGKVRYYTKEEDLIKDSEVEAVYIATPTYLHHKHVLMAAEAKKHILCEKPMAMNLHQAEEMIRACRENKVKLTLDYMMRYHTYNREIKRMIDKGELGKLVMGRAQLTCWYPPIKGAWRQNPELGGGGSLIDMGTHCIDLLEMLMGKVVEVFCYKDHLGFFRVYS